jgi:alkylation response protein AidB-like acyl-CoA dehydrogenase
VARARPVLAGLAAEAARRELDRELPLASVRELAATGVGVLRLPPEHGGAGASLRELFRFVIELAAADSNVAQALRAHFGTIEQLLAAGRSGHWDRWFPRVVAGDIIGNAYTERNTPTLREHRTTLRRTDDGWRLDGEKFYSTGTLYSQLVSTAGRIDGTDRSAFLLVPVDREGVELVDDWEGFGQRLSASGSTRFSDVAVHDDEVLDDNYDAERTTHLIGFFQLYLAGVLAGITRNVATDAVALVRGRTRTYGHAGAEQPRLDPLVQQVVGDIDGLAFAAEATVLAAADALDAAYATSRAGAPDPVVHREAALAVARAHRVVARQASDAAWQLFDAGSASSTDRSRNLDRHWRNARTIASHNPLIYKPRVVGDYLLNGTPPPPSGFF